MRRCLHIFLSDITPAQSRLYKESSFVLGEKILDEVFVLGLWHQGAKIHEIDPSGINIIRKKTLIRKYKKSLFISEFKIIKKLIALVSIIQYAFSAIAVAHRIRPEHVSCHNAAMLPIAWAAARWSGSTLEYLPHELETQRTGLTELGKLITAIVERCFIRFARNVVVVCDPIREWYEKAYGLNNVYVVRNVPEKDAVKLRPIPEGGFRERFGVPDGAKVFIYQGLFSAGRGIEALIDTFSQLASERSHLVLMGYGENSYQDLIDEAVLCYSNIHFQPAVSREFIVSYSASADVGIFISERASLSYRYALPNKFFEWAHAGLPILVSDNLEYQAQLLEEGGFGWAAPLDDLTAAVMRIAETDLVPYAKNARRYAAAAVWDEDAKIFAHIYRRRSV